MSVVGVCPCGVCVCVCECVVCGIVSSCVCYVQADVSVTWCVHVGCVCV